MTDEITASDSENAKSKRTHPDIDYNSRYYSRNASDVSVVHHTTKRRKFNINLSGA